MVACPHIYICTGGYNPTIYASYIIYNPWRIYIHIYIYINLDLHLALFSAHSSFPLDLRSFWLFTLTWTRKHALVFLTDGYLRFFPRYLRLFPEKYAHNFGFKMHKVQKCQKWCNYACVGENRSKSRHLSNEHLFVFFFFEDTGVYIYIITTTIIPIVTIYNYNL